MNILRMGARIISRSSPALLLASGAVLALTFPPVRRGLRTAAVQATKGALIVSDQVKNLTEKMRARASDLVVEAREADDLPCPGTAIKSLRNSARAKGRRMAVATAAGVLSMQKQAQSVRDEFKDIVDEAKQLREEKHAESDYSETEVDEDRTDTHDNNTRVIHDGP